MKIIIVSSGLKPDHFGGLPSHVEDLINALHGAGEEIAYLNVGAKSKWPCTCIVRRHGHPFPAWNLSNTRSYARYWTGTTEPDSQVEIDHAFRRKFFEVIDEFLPHIIHFHELTSLPVGIFEELKRRNIKVVYSAHDFYALCPTVKMLRPDGYLCEKSTEELDCQGCSVDARINRFQQLAYANDQWLAGQLRLRNLGRRGINWLERTSLSMPESSAFQKRRREFVRCLESVDAVVVTSRAQEAIFRQHAGDRLRIRFLPLARATIRTERPLPRKESNAPGKLSFLALNIVNRAKGLDLLRETFAKLIGDFPNIELRIYGLEVVDSPGVRGFGPYDDSQLDEIVASADFGILPSIWPEAFGYVGPEMLSRGLPVIASTMGAMPDYVKDRINGMLFDPRIEGDLASKIRVLISDTSLQRKMWDWAANGERHYLTMEEHVEELRGIYCGLCKTNLGTQLPSEVAS